MAFKGNFEAISLCTDMIIHIICLLSRDQCCRFADELRTSGTFTTMLLSYGTGLLFLILSKKVDLLSKHPAASPRQFVDGSSCELMMEAHYCWILFITFITDEYCS